MSLHIIAEAGTNHNGQADTATRLIEVAKEAGADSVKFQIIIPEGLYLTDIWEGGELKPNPVVAARRKQMLSQTDWETLAAKARTVGIPFSASIFDHEGLALLDQLNPPYVKIASTDLNNGPLLRAAATTGRRLIVSTGMSSLGDVEEAVRIITDTGNSDLVLLHCVSAYPCPTERANLGFIDTLRSAFGFAVGYSDHTLTNVAAIAAVARGATWIEKHYTLDRTAEGFDHAYAMEPDALSGYIADLRATQAAIAPQAVKIGETEATVRRRARRALYTLRDMQPGEIVTEQDVQIVRPEGPLAPNDLPRILGRRLRKPLSRHTAFDLDQFE